MKDSRLRFVLIYSLCIAALNGLLFAVRPPFDGDSFEYAGVARNLALHGRLAADHLSGHFLYDQVLPHPAWNRATLWTFIIAPFYRIFGESHWTFLVPFLISAFLAPPAAYLFGRDVFGEKTGFWGALILGLHPRILAWSTYQDPGHPDILAITLFLATIHLFLKERFIASGVLCGVAFLTRANAIFILPTLFLWTAVFRRDWMRRPRFWLLFAAAAVCCSPLFVRNQIVFKDFLYSDQFSSSRGSGRGAVELLRDFSTLDLMFKWTGYSAPPAPADEGVGLSEILRIAELNGRMVLFGAHNGLEWQPGFFEVFSPLLAPFALFGVWTARGSPEKALAFLYAAAHLFFVCVLKLGYEDRYLLPLLPFLIPFAASGAEALSARLRFVSPRILFAAFVVLESGPTLTAAALTGANGMKPNLGVEVRAVCRWAHGNLPKDAVLMTVPFWSPQFLCERRTIPPIIGTLDQFKEAMDAYGADYLLFTEYWGGDRMPHFDFLRPMIRGRFLTLYAVDRSAPGWEDRVGGMDYMKDFDFFSYFFKEKLLFQFNPPIFKILGGMTGNGTLGAALYFLLAAGLIWILSFRKWRGLLYPVCGAGVIAAFLHSAIPLEKMVGLSRPPISKIQLESALRARGATETSPALLKIQSDDRTTGSSYSKVLESLPGISTESGSMTLRVMPIRLHENYLRDEKDVKKALALSKKERVPAPVTGEGETALRVEGAWAVFGR